MNSNKLQLKFTVMKFPHIKDTNLNMFNMSIDFKQLYNAKHMVLYANSYFMILNSYYLPQQV